MRLAIAVVNAIAFLLLGSPAIAAGKPKLAGAYAYTINSPCQARINTIKGADGDVAAFNGNFGEIYHEIGSATFSAGTVALTGMRVRGALAIIDSVGRKMSPPTPTSLIFAFWNTATTLTVDGNTWPATYANLDSNNVAHFMSFLNRDETNCATTGMFFRRQ